MFTMPGSKAKSPQRAMGVISAALAADVNLSNTGLYFDGPSVAQGPVGNWFVTGTVTLRDTAGAARFFVKLWDGTNIINTCVVETSAANVYTTATLSGPISSPAGNLRISVEDSTSVSGKLIANASGVTKDSFITAVRIG